MKTVMVILVLWAGMAGMALAQCTTNTVFTPDGRVVTCQTCCFGGSCTSQCF